MAVQFGHQALAETHDFVVRLAFRVEVAAAFTAPDGQARQGVLEDLFKAQELDDAQVHRWVKTHATFIGAKGAVELDTEGAVNVDFTTVVLPGHTEDDLAFGFADTLDDLLVGEFRVFHQYGPQGFQHFVNRLVEFFLTRVAMKNVLEDRFELFVEFCSHGVMPSEYAY